MPELACPECRAEIKPDLVDDAGRVECPFCGHSWSLPELPQAKCPLPEVEPVGDVSRPDSEIASTKPLPPLPDGSQIKVVEAADDRLVLYIPGGGKSASGLGCFAVAWNGFMCVFTAILTGALVWGNGNDAPPILGVVAFLGLFWAVGLGVAWCWMKMKYERTFLLLDRDRLVIQRIFFNRKRIEETQLTPESRAALVESYQQNDNPVYRIEVPGSVGAARFGTPLADAEKDWLVDRINDFLGRGGAQAFESPPTPAERPLIADLPTSCRSCGAPLPGELVKGALACAHCGAVFRAAASGTAENMPDATIKKLAPADLPPDGPIRIDEDSPNVLQLHYTIGSNSVWRWLVPVFTVPFSVAWFAGIFSFIGGAWQIPFLPVRILFVVFSIPFLLFGLLPLAIGAIAIRGRTTVRLTPEALQCRWHIGWLGYSRSLPTAAIDRIGIESLAGSRQNPRVRRVRQAGRADAGKVCVTRAGGKGLYLTLFLDETAAQQVAALLRTRLADWGRIVAEG